jgi:hypothetical protein
MDPVNTFRFGGSKNINSGRNEQRVTLILTFDADDGDRNKYQAFLEVRILMYGRREKHINIGCGC